MEAKRMFEQAVVDEEYKIWKKNAPYLYDSVSTYELEWPSLTVAWFPDKIEEKDKKYSLQRLLLGTHTSGGEQNNLMIAQVHVAVNRFAFEQKYYDEETSEYGGFGQGNSTGRLDIVQRINHPGEVNRARCMPQNPDIIATKTNTAEVLVFDRTKHPSEPALGCSPRPELRLLGHTEEGYGLSWSPFVEGRVISCADDGLVCLWDICSPKAGSVPASSVFSEHEGIVEDVAWHLKNEHNFASASDDQTAKLWDARQKSCAATIRGHSSEVNSVAFSPHHDYLLLTGSKDKTVGLWDLRNPSVRLHMLEGHEDAIFRVEFSAVEDSLLASCGADRRVILWDLRRIGIEQTPEDAADGPPEMVFVHGGHTNKVSDFALNANDDWTVASVADNNSLHVWRVAEAIYADEKEVDDSLLE